ncbi:short chain dehydrogenase [Gilvibacter sp. SZ-19]|uniref:short chain dehydrogenase n=1 Tax=Gilvibacter sp. SZ-19 TaxID=754429 RepID=UPI000B3CC655|nr:short chain dehydrogenase [Gilvibacter sp. SZ-19]ARV12514.1 short chain dehydrogenase [Gilvibacter sp. SZ-19]
MKVVVIGGNGTIGNHVVAALKQEHEVVVVGRNSGDIQVDMANEADLIRLFKTTGTVDAVVVTAGDAKWDKFDNLSEDDFYIGINSKLMGQVNVVRIAKDYLSQGGSITLSTGILADDPVDMTTSAAMVNGAIHSFVKAVVLELDAVRVNVVCAGLVEDAYEKYKDYFPGHDPVSMAKVTNAYLKSVLGKINGQIIRVNA